MRGLTRWLGLGMAGLALLAAACAPDPTTQRAPRPLEVGDRAPGFTLTTPDEKPVSLADFLDRRPVLLYFSMGPG